MKFFGNLIFVIFFSPVPAKISSFSKTVIGVAGSHLTLECNAVGLPTPSCVWKKIGASLPMESKLVKSFHLAM